MNKLVILKIINVNLIWLKLYYFYFHDIFLLFSYKSILGFKLYLDSSFGELKGFTTNRFENLKKYF